MKQVKAIIQPVNACGEPRAYPYCKLFDSQEALETWHKNAGEVTKFGGEIINHTEEVEVPGVYPPRLGAELAKEPTLRKQFKYVVNLMISMESQGLPWTNITTAFSTLVDLIVYTYGVDRKTVTNDVMSAINRAKYEEKNRP